LLSPEPLKGSGLFKAGAVGQLVRKVETGKPLGETDDMALVGIISTQLLHHQFVVDLNLPPPISDADNIKVRYGSVAPNQEIQHELCQERSVH
jgi:asparagine synthase (glutamine-hydrolysing)